MATAPTLSIDGTKLRELRKLMGDDLKGFAARAGITFQYLSQIELGRRRRVSPPTFVRICNALGVTNRREMLASSPDRSSCQGLRADSSCGGAAAADGPRRPGSGLTAARQGG